jgi:hypothetical protein
VPAAALPITLTPACFAAASAVLDGSEFSVKMAFVSVILIFSTRSVTCLANSSAEVSVLGMTEPTNSSRGSLLRKVLLFAAPDAFLH